jgi:hypothetical protein
MVKPTLIFWSLHALLVAASFMTGYTYRGEPQETNYKELVDNNSRIIHSLGVTSKMQSTNIGLLEEILDQFRDQPYDVKSTDTRNKSLFQLYHEVELDDDVPETHSQVLSDQNEINMSVQSLGWGNIFMEDSLRQILDNIKEEK